MLTNDEVDAWVRSAFPYGCPFTYDMQRELAEHDARRRAQEYTKSATARELAELRKRLVALEKRVAHVIAPNGDLSEAMEDLLAQIIADEREGVDAKIQKLESKTMRAKSAQKTGEVTIE